MQTAPSARDDTIHKQLHVIPKGTTPSIENEKNMQTPPSARDDTVDKQINSKTDDTIRK